MKSKTYRTLVSMLIAFTVFACNKEATKPQSKNEALSFKENKNSTLKVLDREWSKAEGDCITREGTCLPTFTVEEEALVAFNEFVNAVNGNENEVCNYFYSSYWEEIFSSMPEDEIHDLRTCNYDLIEVSGRAANVRFFFAGHPPVTDSTFEFVIPVDISRLR